MQNKKFLIKQNDPDREEGHNYFCGKGNWTSHFGTADRAKKFASTDEAISYIQKELGHTSKYAIIEATFE